MSGNFCHWFLSAALFILVYTFLQSDMSLPAKQQADVPVGSTVRSVKGTITDTMLDAHRVCPGVCVGRTLLPATNKGLVVRLMNTTNRKQLLNGGLCLGQLSPVDVDDKVVVGTHSIHQMAPLTSFKPVHAAFTIVEICLTRTSLPKLL